MKSSQIDGTAAHQAAGLVPGPPQLAPNDPVHGGTLEDHVIVQIERRQARRQAQQRSLSPGLEQTEPGVHRLGGAGHLEQHVDALPIRCLQHGRGDVVGGGVDDEIGTHLASQFEPVVRYVGGIDRTSTKCLGGGKRHDADRPHPRHENLAPGNRRRAC